MERAHGLSPLQTQQVSYSKAPALMAGGAVNSIMPNYIILLCPEMFRQTRLFPAITDERQGLDNSYKQTTNKSLKLFRSYGRYWIFDEAGNRTWGIIFPTATSLLMAGTESGLQLPKLC